MYLRYMQPRKSTQERSTSTQKWHEIADQLKIEGRSWIGGEYVEAEDGDTFTNISPIDGRELGEIASCTATDVDRAVISAQKVFDLGTWANASPSRKKRTLLKFAELINKKRDELALLETLDMGKPIRWSLSLDIPAAARVMQWYAELIDKINEDVAPVDRRSLTYSRREPLGVVAVIVPWNFPLLTAVTKIAPALATGNSVILKPAEQSSLTAIKLGEIAQEAGLPDGVLNIVTGTGLEAGEPIGLHNDIAGVSFTGSTEIGKKLMTYAGESNMKKLSLECGGKSPNIVFADSQRLERAAKATAAGIFFNQGQVCQAASRLLVEESVRERFTEMVVAEAQGMKPGDPLNPETLNGAMVDETHTQRVLKYIEEGRQQADVVVSGGRVLEETGGSYLAPTIFSDVSNDMTIAQEEIFGPVLSIIGFQDESEAIEIANDSVYGLTSGVWTNDIERAHRVAGKMQSGTVWVNTWDAVDPSVPFGGVGQSGFGRDRSTHALDNYTQLKTTWIQLT